MCFTATQIGGDLGCFLFGVGWGLRPLIKRQLTDVDFRESLNEWLALVNILHTT